MRRSVIIGIVAVVVLAVVAILVVRQPGERSTSVAGKEKLADLDSASIYKIHINSQFGEMELEKKNEGWYLTKPVNAPANENQVKLALRFCPNMKVLNVVSKNPDKHSIFLVDSTGARVKIYQKDKLKADFYVGKNGDGYQDNYVRLAGSDETVLVKGPLSYIFYSPVKRWRDNSILDIKPTDITSVKYQYENEQFSIARKDTSWYLDGKIIDKSEVERVLGSLAMLKSDSFAEIDSLPKQSAVIDVNDVQLQFALNEEASSYLVSSSKSSELFIVNQPKADKILKKKEDFVK